MEYIGLRFESEHGFKRFRLEGEGDELMHDLSFALLPLVPNDDTRLNLDHPMILMESEEAQPLHTMDNTQPNESALESPEWSSQWS